MSKHTPERRKDFDIARDASAQPVIRPMYRYSVEYAYGGGNRGNAFIHARDQAEAREKFKVLYPDSDIESLRSLGPMYGDGKNRYSPCPNCASDHGMGISSRDRKQFVLCTVCGFEGPGLKYASPSAELDKAVFDAWNLLSAAPELLEVAKLVVEFFGTNPIEDMLDADIRLRDTARAAIAKAEGA